MTLLPKFTLTICLILVQTIYTYSQIIPASRITNWDNPGSMPVFSIEKTVILTSFGADSTGMVPSDNALEQAINELNGPGEIVVPRGTYLFEQPIELPDSILISGETDSLSSSPLVLFNLFPGENNHGISIRGNETNTIDTITYPLMQGQQKLFVHQPQLFKAGDFIRLVPFDDSLLVNDSWAYHSTGQLFEILEIIGDSLSLNKPLRRSYGGSRHPEIHKLIPRQQVHIKCIKIERLDQTAAQTSTIYVNHAVDCSISGIESHYGNYAHVDIVNSTRISVEKSFFTNAHDYGSGGKGYGIMLESTSGDCFIHANNFEHLRHSMILQSGANGNILAYNYSIDPYWTGTALPSNSAGDLVLHGNYVYMNLLEGNIVQNIVIDNSHDINGPHNTFFRNRAELYGIFMNNAPASDEQNFIGNQVTNTSSLFLGLYLLQGTNHFEYGNMIKGTVSPAGTIEPEKESMFDYNFNSFYQFISSVPPIRNNNWQSQTPLTEAAYRFQVSGKKVICDDIHYLPTSIEASGEMNYQAFDVYPNPFNHEITIHQTSGLASYFVKIHDISGRLILSSILTGEYTNVQMPDLNPGMYLLNIEGKENIVYKMMKY